LQRYLLCSRVALLGRGKHARSKRKSERGTKCALTALKGNQVDKSIDGATNLLEGTRHVDQAKKANWEHKRQGAGVSILLERALGPLGE